MWPAGLIAVIMSGVIALDDGTGRSMYYVFAAITISGAIQILLGLLKVGRMASVFPSSVIHGVLAGIGMIIFAGQMHVALGTVSTAPTTIGVLADLIHQLPNANPYVVGISVMGVLLMVFSTRINYKLFRFVPAPIWVLALSVPLAYAFNLLNEHSLPFLQKDYAIGPDLLLIIPSDLTESIVLPDFSVIGTSTFWMTVLSITAIASIETLAIGRAIDKMDPYRRNTDLNKELVAVGISTMVSGAMGGLPIIPEIVRSTVNVHNQAKTKWSNFFQGVILLLFILVLSPLLGSVPLAALAAILVHTGYKLASPKVFKHAYDTGVEQLLFLVSTILITLFTNLLYGIIGGMLVALLLHMLLAKVGVGQFFKKIFRSGSKVYTRADGTYDIKIKGIANFLFTLNLNKLLGQVPLGSGVTVDLSQTRLVDLSVMEIIIEFKRTQENEGGNVTIIGLDNHVSSNSHNRALKIIAGPPRQKITTRQIQLQKMANQNKWSFQKEVDWNTSYLRNFHFFDSRPIERKTNSLKGRDMDNQIDWEIADIRFDEGALLSSEVYHTTIQIIHLPTNIPEFTIEKEGLFDRIFDPVRTFTGYKDIDFALYPKFSSKFLLMGKDEQAVRGFFNEDLIGFFEKNQIHHIESNGESLMILKYLHLARTDEVQNMLRFSHDLLESMNLSSDKHGKD